MVALRVVRVVLEREARAFFQLAQRGEHFECAAAYAREGVVRRVGLRHLPPRDGRAREGLRAVACARCLAHRGVVGERDEVVAHSAHRTRCRLQQIENVDVWLERACREEVRVALLGLRRLERVGGVERPACGDAGEVVDDAWAKVLGVCLECLDVRGKRGRNRLRHRWRRGEDDARRATGALW